jgi:uncharacterized membrane protein YidH (DUF202 family)
MTNANAHGETAAKDFALKSLQMAAERTDLALIRAGFTTATFGAGMTHLIGRGIWPDRMVDILTIIFVIAGALGVQAGLLRLQKRIKNPHGPEDHDRLSKRLLMIGSYVLQAALVAIIIMTLVHSG